MLIGINTKLENINAIVLSGHIDTVNISEKLYGREPFKAIYKDDELYGLGIVDMKCFFATIIDNLEEIKKSKLPIIVAVTSDEETNLNGIEKVIETLKERKIRPIISIIGEPTSMQVLSSSKSFDEYWVEVQGKSCHSSKVLEGINVNYILSHLALEIEKLNLKYFKNGTSLNCGEVKCGEVVNVVPDYGELKFEIRSKAIENTWSAIKKFDAKIKELENVYKGCKITYVHKYSLPPLTQKVKLTSKIIEKLNLTEGEFVGGCEAPYYQKLGGEAFLFGAGELSLAHKTNEHIKLEDYEKYNNLLCKVIKQINEIV